MGRPPGTTLIVFNYKGKTLVTRIDRVVQRGEADVQQTDTVRKDGQGALEGAPAEDVPGASDAGEAGGSAVRSTGDDQGRDGRADAAGDGPSGGVGSCETKLDSPSRRGNDADLGERSGGVDGARQRVKVL